MSEFNDSSDPFGHAGQSSSSVDTHPKLTPDPYASLEQFLSPDSNQRALAKSCYMDAAKWRDIHQRTKPNFGEWKTATTISMVDEAMKASKETLGLIRNCLQSHSSTLMPTTGTLGGFSENSAGKRKAELDQKTNSMYLSQDGKSAVFALYDWALSEKLISADHVLKDLKEIRTFCLGKPRFADAKAGFPGLLQRCSTALTAQNPETEDVIRLLLKTALASEFPKYADGLSAWRVLDA